MEPIAKDQALAWLADSDVEIAGAAHAYLEKARHSARVTPPLSEDEFAQLSVEYLKRCLLGTQEGEWVQSRFEAAWALVSWLARQAKQPSVNAVGFVRWLGDSYKANLELRNVVITGLLEHVLGSKDVDRLFISWECDPELAQALSSAREWKKRGGRSPIDLK
ncbi:hypothetical protein [Ramlibacter humi]|uniref:Uncharacterized protein n=1 Tax=Ramlibacter humi TaxID=2530451 RepID=A0A4Z0BFE0_9BURK|nr:hypothetical protein [Ramlibacter humi]TFY97099.1 hypothetical protein EZ216_19765 [Ramlibacter humi]